MQSGETGGTIALTCSTAKTHGAHFMTSSGRYEDTITLQEVPAGDYVLEWIDPSTGAVKHMKPHDGGGDLVLKTPPYAVDVALRMGRKASARQLRSTIR